MAPSARSQFSARREACGTKLTMHIAAPGPQCAPEVPTGIDTVSYRSSDLRLPGYFVPPASAPPAVSPAILYSHGGCAITQQDFEVARIFSEAGYAVFLPSYRGEQGNPGAYELFFGEVDDACAALRWLAGRPEIDQSGIFAFGYSMGGEISALLSLFDGLPLRSTASCGPFFLRSEPFGSESMYGAPVPFDPFDETEVGLRLLTHHLDEMVCPHIAFIGRQDEKFADGKWRDVRTDSDKLRIVEVEGTHDTSLIPAVRAFVEFTCAPT